MHIYGSIPVNPGVNPPNPPLTAKSPEKDATLLDIAVFAPLTILGALNKEPPTWMRMILMVYGVGSLANSIKKYRELP